MINVKAILILAAAFTAVSAVPAAIVNRDNCQNYVGNCFKNGTWSSTNEILPPISANKSSSAWSPRAGEERAGTDNERAPQTATASSAPHRTPSAPVPPASGTAAPARSAAAAPGTRGPATPTAVPAFKVSAVRDNTRAAVASRFWSLMMHLDCNRRLTRMLAEPFKAVRREAKGTENPVFRLYRR